MHLRVVKPWNLITSKNVKIRDLIYQRLTYFCFLTEEAKFPWKKRNFEILVSEYSE